MTNTTPTPPDASQPLVLAGSLDTAKNFTEYAQQWWARIRAGDTGVLPVLCGLIILAIVFQGLNSNFLTAGNLVNLIVQGSVYMLFALGMVFILLLGEIDLSNGFIGGVAGVVMATLIYGTSIPWYVGLGAGLLTGVAIGLLNGIIITFIGLPAFIVTLAGLLAWNGVMLIILGNGGTVPINDVVIQNLASGLLTPIVGWIVMIVLVVIYLADMLLSERRRRAKGNLGVPNSVILLKIVGMIVAGVIVVLICNVNRGRGAVVIEGVPWVLLIVLALTTLWNIVLSRTAFGTYIYAIGGNAEAARRAGISVRGIRIAVFAIAGFMGAVAGIIYASRLSSVSTNLDGGQLVLYSIAAAVIGGTSLFGGRGKAVHAILGGLVIAEINNGMGLLLLPAADQYVVTGVVLVIAVTIDAFASRGRASSGLG